MRGTQAHSTRNTYRYQVLQPSKNNCLTRCATRLFRATLEQLGQYALHESST